MSLALNEISLGTLSLLSGVFVMDHEDCLLCNLTLENWHLFQKSLVTEQLLACTFLMLKFWCSKFSALKLLWLVLDSDVPLGPFLHLEKFLNHINDGLHFLGWILLNSIEKLSHSSTVVSD